MVRHPTIHLAQHVAKAGHSKGRGEIGVKLKCLVEAPRCLAVILLGPLMKACHPTQKVIIGVKASRGLPFGPLDFGLLQLRRNRTHYAHSHSILQIEYVFKITLEAVSPEMSGCCSIDELSRNAHSVR